MKQSSLSAGNIRRLLHVSFLYDRVKIMKKNISERIWILQNWRMKQNEIKKINKWNVLCLITNIHLQPNSFHKLQKKTHCLEFKQYFFLIFVFGSMFLIYLLFLISLQTSCIVNMWIPFETRRGIFCLNVQTATFCELYLKAASVHCGGSHVCSFNSL